MLWSAYSPAMGAGRRLHAHARAGTTLVEVGFVTARLCREFGPSASDASGGLQACRALWPRPTRACTKHRDDHRSALSGDVRPLALRWLLRRASKACGLCAEQTNRRYGKCHARLHAAAPGRRVRCERRDVHAPRRRPRCERQPMGCCARFECSSHRAAVDPLLLQHYGTKQHRAHVIICHCHIARIPVSAALACPADRNDSSACTARHCTQSRYAHGIARPQHCP